MSSIEELARAFTRAAASRNRTAAVTSPTPSHECRRPRTTVVDVIDELWARIGRKVEGGASFADAVEQVLAEEVPENTKADGQPVARRAASDGGVPCHGPDASRKNDQAQRAQAAHVAVVKAEVDRLWAAIDAMVIEGMQFYTARDLIVVREIPRVAKTFGQVVATCVELMVLDRDPASVSPAAFAAVRTRNRARIEAALRKSSRTGRIRILDRIWLKLYGRPFGWELAVVTPWQALMYSRRP